MFVCERFRVCKRRYRGLGLGFRVHSLRGLGGLGVEERLKTKKNNEPDIREEWRSCTEFTLNELWRYNIRYNKWESEPQLSVGTILLSIVVPFYVFGLPYRILNKKSWLNPQKGTAMETIGTAFAY